MSIDKINQIGKLYKIFLKKLLTMNKSSGNICTDKEVVDFFPRPFFNQNALLKLNKFSFSTMESGTVVTDSSFFPIRDLDIKVDLLLHKHI